MDTRSADDSPASATRLALLVAVVLFLSIAEVRLVLNNFDGQFREQIQASQGIVEGLPHWRLFQSRVLGPYLVHAVQRSTGLNLEQAYSLMMFVWLAAFFAVLVAAAVRLFRSVRTATAIAGSAAFLCATLMQGDWLYPWDFIDLTIFTLIVWAVMSQQPLSIVAGIITIEMFNREAATVLAGWLALDAGLAWRRKAGAETPSTGAAPGTQLGVALFLVVASVVIAEVLRSALLVREIGPEIFPPPTRGPGQLVALQIDWNVRWLVESILIWPRWPYHLVILAIPLDRLFEIRDGLLVLRRQSRHAEVEKRAAIDTVLSVFPRHRKRLLERIPSVGVILLTQVAIAEIHQGVGFPSAPANLAENRQRILRVGERLVGLPQPHVGVAKIEPQQPLVEVRRHRVGVRDALVVSLNGLLRLAEANERGADVELGRGLQADISYFLRQLVARVQPFERRLVKLLRLVPIQMVAALNLSLVGEVGALDTQPAGLEPLVKTLVAAEPPVQLK